MRTIETLKKHSPRSILSAAVALLLVPFGVTAFSPAAQAQVAKQNVVITQSTNLGSYASGGGLAGGDAAGNTAAVNANGDVIQSNTYGGQIVLFSGKGTGATVLGSFSNPGPVAVDSASNLYIGGLYSAMIVKIPYTASTNTYAAISTPSSSTVACTGTTADTTECYVPNLTTAASTGGYFGVLSLAFDATGNLFFATTNANTAPNTIFECTVACQKTGGPSVNLIYTEPTSSTPDTTGQLTVGAMALDPTGNLFFTDSAIITATKADPSPTLPAGASVTSNLKELALSGTTFATTTQTLYSITPSSVTASDNQIDGVVTDAAGTVFFVDQYDGLFAIPNNKGVTTPANIFAVGSHGAKVVATDGKGNFFLDYYSGGDIEVKYAVGTAVGPAAVVGTPTTSTTVQTLVNDGGCSANTGITFTSSTTEFSAATSGACTGTLTGAYYPTTLTFNPSASGTRTATLTAKDTVGNSGTSAVSGTATGGTTTTVATPTFSVSGGTYSSTQTVAISDTTAGASIYYTLNGTTPTSSSTLYTGPITVASSETVNAIGILSGSTNSAVATAVYTITVTVATPTISPAGGTFTAPQTVTLADSTTGASIYYSLDGSTPSASNTLYTAPFTLNSSQTVNAIGILSGDVNSAVATAAFSITLPNAVAPTFSPVGGTYTTAQTVTLSSTTPGAVIYYTLNGTTPTTASTKYTAPFSVGTTQTVTANTVATGYNTSATSTATYTITQATVATPTFTPAAGTYTTTQTVALASTTAGASIYYTVNGSTPTTSSTLYTGPISVGTTETIMAIATLSGSTNSAVASATYTINFPAAGAPTFSPAGGTYTATQSVTLASTTAGAAIYYTVNGSTPTTASTLYTGPISVTATETIMAIATPGTATNVTSSAVSSATYTINLPAATPTFSPAGGTYTAAQTVTIADTTTGAAIYYTINGTTPTTASTLYTGPITVSSSETIMAIATATGSSSSAVASAAYTISIPTVTTPTPTFSVAAGAFTAPIAVSLADTNVNAVIYYTTNGTTPTTASTVYTGGIVLNSTTTIMAIAVAPGAAPSAVASATYTLTTGTPTFTVTTSATLTVSNGSSNSMSVVVKPSVALTSPVTLACSGLPSGSTCTFNPATLTTSTTSGSATTLTVTSAAFTSANRTTPTNLYFPGATFAAMLCLLGFKKRRRMQLFLLVAFSAIGLGMVTGCGSSTVQTHAPVLSTVTITGTSGTVTATTTFVLTVQ